MAAQIAARDHGYKKKRRKMFPTLQPLLVQLHRAHAFVAEVVGELRHHQRVRLGHHALRKLDHHRVPIVPSARLQERPAPALSLLWPWRESHRYWAERRTLQRGCPYPAEACSGNSAAP